jgi:hypothetical protein
VKLRMSLSCSVALDKDFKDVIIVKLSKVSCVAFYVRGLKAIIHGRPLLTLPDKKIRLRFRKLEPIPQSLHLQLRLWHCRKLVNDPFDQTLYVFVVLKDF